MVFLPHGTNHLRNFWPDHAYVVKLLLVVQHTKICTQIRDSADEIRSLWFCLHVALNTLLNLLDERSAGAVLQMPQDCWLILEYLPGGSLTEWLHGAEGKYVAIDNICCRHILRVKSMSKQISTLQLRRAGEILYVLRTCPEEHKAFHHDIWLQACSG